MAAQLISAIALSGNADCKSDLSLRITGVMSIVDVAIAQIRTAPIWPLGTSLGRINRVLIVNYFFKPVETFKAPIGRINGRVNSRWAIRLGAQL